VKVKGFSISSLNYVSIVLFIMVLSRAELTKSVELRTTREATNCVATS
jgi:hypothetical protein